MVDARFLRALREAKRWSQSDVAEATGINQPRVSLYERSERLPTRRDSGRLEQALALGAPREGEVQPVFALAARLDKRGGLHLALARGPRIGVYRDSESATAAAQIVRRIRPDMAGKVGVVPVWLEAAFAAVVAAKAARAEPNDVYVVDGSSDTKKVVAALADHAVEIADWLDDLRSATRGNDVAALADAFLKLRKQDSASAA